jgi:hypothetical protein
VITARWFIASEGVTEESKISLIGASSFLLDRCIYWNVVEVFDWEVLSIDA